MIKFNCDITCPVVLFPPFNRAMDDALSVLVRDMCFAVGRASRDAPGMQRARCVQCPRLLLAETAACSFTVTSTAARLFTPMGQPCGVCFIGRIVGGGARHGRVLIAARKGVGLLRGRFCPGAGPRGRQRDRTAEGQQPLHSARASVGSTLLARRGVGRRSPWWPPGDDKRVGLGLRRQRRLQQRRRLMGTGGVAEGRGR